MKPTPQTDDRFHPDRTARIATFREELIRSLEALARALSPFEDPLAPEHLAERESGPSANGPTSAQWTCR